MAILAFESESDALSDFIMDELAAALIDRGVEVADQQHLELVSSELDFQMTGAVSDETALSAGRFLVAGLVVTGQFRNLGMVRRLTANAIRVDTATRVSAPRADVPNDEMLRQMILALGGQPVPTPVPTPALTSVPAPAPVAAATMPETAAPPAAGTGWLGIRVLNPNRETAEALGVHNRVGALVTNVVISSPAGNGGINPGDFITHVNGREVRDVSQLTMTAGDLRPGDNTVFTLIPKANHQLCW